MNRRGFAITTVIYGLSLLGIMVVTMLMGILSTTRNNITRESDRIEKVLINYNMSSKEYKGSATEQTYVTPAGETGWYRIEAFGASGKNSNPEDPNNGPGAYTTGIIYLKESDTLKIKTGMTSGSKATEIYISNGATKTLIMRAAGGNNAEPGGTLMKQTNVAPGAQISREESDLATGNLLGTTVQYVSTGNNPPSVIKGYPWGCSTNANCNGKVTLGGNEYYFVDGFMMASTNIGNGKVIIQRIKEDDVYNNYQIQLQTTAEGIGIDPPENPIKRIPRINKKFDDVTKITITSPNFTVESAYYTSAGTVKQISSGSSFPATNIDDIGVVFTQKNTNLYNVKISVTHSTGIQEEIYFSDDSSHEKGLFSTPTGIKLSAYQPDSLKLMPNHGNYYIFPITTEGYAMSVPSMSTSADGLVEIERINGEPRQKWSIDLLNDPNKDEGEPNFKDIANKSGMYEYRILELARSKSLTVQHDENRKNGTIAANQTFNAVSRNDPQIWNIRNNNDGTFSIRTANPSQEVGEMSGYLFANTTLNSDHLNKILIGKAKPSAASENSETLSQPKQTQRFILYTFDFSTTQDS